jgi:hypothetical protein
VLAADGEYCFIRALDLARAVVVAPVMYSLIIWSTLWGFLIFAQLPNVWTIVGASIVVASGIYTFCRETRVARHIGGCIPTRDEYCIPSSAWPVGWSTDPADRQYAEVGYLHVAAVLEEDVVDVAGAGCTSSCARNRSTGCESILAMSLLHPSQSARSPVAGQRFPLPLRAWENAKGA